MKIQEKMHQGKLLKRYKRFFADIEWNGQVVVAHVPNTGSMKGCNSPGSTCLFTESTNPERKLKYTLEMVQSSTGAWVGVNTSRPNALVKEALHSQLLSHWKGFDEIKPEFKITKESRFDFALLKNNKDQKHFIEVKNVSLSEGDCALFPDSVTERGQKHLRELMRLKDEGHTCEIVFVVQRNDVKSFSAAQEIDPEYAKLLLEAKKAGVVVTALCTEYKNSEIKLLDQKLKLQI